MLDKATRQRILREFGAKCAAKKARREEEYRLKQSAVEIKTAQIGNCEKCLYRKAKYTRYAKCDHCAELPTYFNWCHGNVFKSEASKVLYVLGLTPYVDVLQIGYDKATREIILPLNKNKYVSVELTNGGLIVDTEKAARVLRHYNLLPRTNAKVKMRRNAAGVVEVISRNNDVPYSDKKFVGVDGQVVIAV